MRSWHSQMRVSKKFMRHLFTISPRLSKQNLRLSTLQTRVMSEKITETIFELTPTSVFFKNYDEIFFMNYVHYLSVCDCPIKRRWETYPRSLIEIPRDGY